MQEQEFKIAILPQGPKIFRIAKRFVNQDQDASDVVQEIFIKLWKMRNNLKEIHNLDGYIATITKNYCLDVIRGKQTVRFTNEITFDKPTMENGPGKIFENKSNGTFISKILHSLPEQQRLIVQLKDIEGYSTPDAAKVLNISENAFRVTLSRARKKIREE